jgi:hypothetical protein
MRKRQRDYQKEYLYHGTEKQKERRAERNAARNKMEDAGRVRKGDGKDVNHKNRRTSDNSMANLSVTSQKANRGWRKGKAGY